MVLDPNWTQLFGVKPSVGTNYLFTASAFVRPILHLLAGEGVWGRGRHLSPFPSSPFEVFLSFSLFSKYTSVAPPMGSSGMNTPLHGLWHSRGYCRDSPSLPLAS